MKTESGAESRKMTGGGEGNARRAERLVAYVVPARGKVLSADELRAFVRARLPEYMVPAAFLALDAMPLAPTGKVDRRALPSPREALSLLSTPPVAPRGPIEETIERIWSEVLDLDSVGVQYDFFDVGGHSLLATQVLARVRDTFAVDVPLRAFFENPTVAGLAALVDAARSTDPGSAPRPDISRIERASRDSDLPLSFAQERLWIQEELGPESGVYNVLGAVRLDGPLDADALEKTLNDVVQRHDSLRMTFVSENGRPRLRVARKHHIGLTQLDLSSLPAAEREGRACRVASLEAGMPFDIARGPLVRGTLIRLAEDQHLLAISIHHIVCDGWSIGILIEEIGALYDASVRGVSSPLAPLTIQYPDYAAWQRSWLDGDALNAQLRFWKDALEGAPPVLALPTDRPRGTVARYHGGRRPLVVDRALTDALSSLARAQNATLFMVLLTALDVLLARYAGQSDIVVGSPIANRPRLELEGLIGFFVNMIALRATISDSDTYATLLERVRAATLNAYANADTPFEQVVDAVAPERDLARSPIFQVCFALQNAPSPPFDLHGLVVTPLDIENPTAKFDLTFSLEPSPAGLVGNIEYDADLFDTATVDRIARHYLNILRAVVERPQERWDRIPLIDAAERMELMRAWDAVPDQGGRGAVLAPPASLAHRLFEEQAARTPHRVAVRDAEGTVSYAEIDGRANQIAHALLRAGVAKESIVALLLDRSADFLACMLGVFKAGAAYVPLDPRAPEARLALIIKQTGCPLVLTEARYDAVTRPLARDGVAIVQARAILSDGADELTTTAPAVDVSERELAYVIYTSGSTGTPKGAMIEHGGMLNHLMAKISDLDMTGRDVVAQTATQTFDVSVWQFLAPLLVGGQVSVFDDEAAWEPGALVAQLIRDDVTIFESVPSHMKIILDELESAPERASGALRWFIMNGEGLPPELCKRWFRLFPEIAMINTYGATECSDDTAHFKIFSSPTVDLPLMPLQGSLPGLRTYVLDKNLACVPTGIAGEIYLGGRGVGRGYLADPVKTALSFIPDPFSDQPGARMYRTGDIGCLRSDGNLEFLGRSDHQIKIRGHRIEIGEIETAIAAHPLARDVVVVARDAGRTDKILVAYIVAASGATLDARSVTQHLKPRLLSYMVPSAFVFLDTLPLLSNGKVDRKSLPAPDIAVGARDDIVPPRTEVEKSVARVWSDVLGVADVGVTDNFFEVGGNSLAAIQTVSRLRRILDVELSIRAVIQAATVESIAAIVEEKLAESGGASRLSELAAHALRRLPPQEHYDLAPYQLPEWYMRELEPDSPFYNVAVTDVLFTGPLDLAAFVGAWQTIIERHDALRVRFAYVDGKPVQRVGPAPELRVADVHLDLTSTPQERVEEEMQRLARAFGNTIFDFMTGPMFRLKVAEFPGQRFLLLFLVHHILWDETSTINLALELSELYNAERAKRVPRLPALELDYVDYAQCVKNRIESGYYEVQRRYWVEKLTPTPPALDLPLDHPRPPIQTFNGATVGTWLPAQTGARLRVALSESNTTLYTFLLAVLNLQLHRLSGQTDFVVGTPIANRDDERLEPLIGLFATALPMRCTLRPGMTFAELLTETRDTALEALDHQNYPSILAIQQIESDMDLSRNRLFSVMYGLQNNKTRLMQELHLDGVELTFLTNISQAEADTAKFDLTYIVDEFGGDISMRLNFNSDLFEQRTAERILHGLVHLLEQVLEDPRARLDHYTSGESDTISIVRSEPPADCEPSLDVDCIHRAFERCAQEAPDALAVVADERSWSYAELDAAATRIAETLRDGGVSVEDRVGVALDASFALIAAVLAVHKAGAAYVAVTPDMPAERRDAVFAQAAVSAVIQPPPAGGEQPDVELRQARSRASSTPRAAGPRDLAYLIFTSGTTGTPKGITIEHGGIVNLIASTQLAYGLGPEDAVLLTTPPTFDAFVLDVFWPLAVGARVVLPAAGETRDPVRLGARVQSRGVTAFQSVPAMLGAMVDAKARGEIAALPSLRLVICGGAPLGAALSRRYGETFDAALANHYGPSEVTVDATRYDCRRPCSREIVAIGDPISGAAVYVLDDRLSPVARGVIGQIYVNSPGLARGYHDDPERTALAFLPDPFGAPGARMYATGDLGRIDDDGCVHFLGRRDRQVKIRGNRVELEEIESRLTAHDAVACCAVRHHRDDAGDALVAHVELHERVNTITARSGTYRFFTLAQRPDLKSAVDAIHVGSWPDYFEGDCTMRTYWPKLATQFPQCQAVIVNDADDVLAAGNALPVTWNGTLEDLPRGWDDALRRGFVDAENGREANTYMMLTAVVARQAQGMGLSTAILEVFKSVARDLAFERVVVAVRPTGKAARPDLTFEEWCTKRRPDGQLEDNWLRGHERVGGTVLEYDLTSQKIVGSVEDWQRWSDRQFPTSGVYDVKDALLPVSIDLEAGTGEYHDPAVWIEHHYDADADGTAWRHIDAAELRRHLRESLPDYMIPEHIRFLPVLPRTDAGKVDERALPAIVLDPRLREIGTKPQNSTQERIAAIWSEVLELDEVGIDEDFFALGGHSIRAVRMLAKATEAFGVTISLKALFTERTIRGLERLLRETRDEALGAEAADPQRMRPSGAERPRAVLETPVAVGRGSAIAHHGEVLQGITERDSVMHRCLVSLPCEVFQSKATFHPNTSGVVTVSPEWRVKAQRAAELALSGGHDAYFGGHLEIHSTIPIGWGMGSSTSDIIAAVRAVHDAFARPSRAVEVAELAVRAEGASDSTMFSNRVVLFAQREGLLLEDFGRALPEVEIVGFNTDPTGEGIDTLTLPQARYSWREIEEFRVIIGLLRRAIRTGSARLLGLVMSASARISQRYLPKRGFDRIERLAEMLSAVGIQVAHSGTVAGLVFDARDPQTSRRVERARRLLAEMDFGDSWHWANHE